MKKQNKTEDYTVLLTREEFKKQVFARTNNMCCVPGCKNHAVDAHHIMDRKLFSDGGYYLGNGASLCAEHHLQAENGEITPLDCIYYMQLTFEEAPVPDKLSLSAEEYFELLSAGKLNKWGE
jgi:hypothetical protein